jgi:anti-anti-sigma factor
MQMDIRPLGERLVRITLTGRLDTSGVDRIETRLIAALVPGANNAVLDLSQVEFIASMGIRMLIAAARTLKTRQAVLAICGAQDQVRQVFDTVALSQVIPIYSTEAEALLTLAPRD